MIRNVRTGSGKRVSVDVILVEYGSRDRIRCCLVVAVNVGSQ